MSVSRSKTRAARRLPYGVCLRPVVVLTAPTDGTASCGATLRRFAAYSSVRVRSTPIRPYACMPGRAPTSAANVHVQRRRLACDRLGGVDFRVGDGIQVVRGRQLETADAVAGQPVRVSYTLRNNGRRAITVPYVGVVARVATVRLQLGMSGVGRLAVDW